MSLNNASFYTSICKIFQAFADSLYKEVPSCTSYNSVIKFLVFPIIADIFKSLQFYYLNHTSTIPPKISSYEIDSCFSLSDTCNFRQSNPHFRKIADLLQLDFKHFGFNLENYIYYKRSYSQLASPVFHRNYFGLSTIYLTNLSASTIFQRLIPFILYPLRVKLLKIEHSSHFAFADICLRQRLINRIFSLCTELTDYEFKVLIFLVVIYPTVLCEDFGLLLSRIFNAKKNISSKDYIATANGIQSFEVLAFMRNDVRFKLCLLQHGFGYKEVNDYDIRYIAESKFADSFHPFLGCHSIPSFKLTLNHKKYFLSNHWITVFSQPFSLYPGLELLASNGQEVNQCYDNTNLLMNFLISRFPKNSINFRCPSSPSIISYGIDSVYHKSSNLSIRQVLLNSHVSFVIGVSTVFYESLLSSTPTFWIVSNDVLDSLCPKLQELADLMRSNQMFFTAVNSDMLKSIIEIDHCEKLRKHMLHRNYMLSHFQVYSHSKFAHHFYQEFQK